MRVYPKRPERVVEVEHNHLRQWEAVCESFGGAEFIIEDGGWNTTCWRLGLGTYHPAVEEEEQGNCRDEDVIRTSCKTPLKPHTRNLLVSDETLRSW